MIATRFAPAAVSACGVLAGACVSLPARAHGFGQRFDLPLPLWLWVSGAAATLVASFALVALFMRDPVARRAASWCISGRPPGSWLVRPSVVVAVRTFGVLLFLVALAAGFFGTPDPYRNLVITLVWIVWWVGFAFVCALVGDLWALASPITALFDAARALCRGRSSGRRARDGVARYPRWLGAWPAAVAFLIFAWCELVWGGRDVPTQVAGAVLLYAAWSWAGMAIFGRDDWLRHAEAFAVAFSVFGRFAPLDGRAPRPGDRALWLRTPGTGLFVERPLTPSMVFFVLAMLATVTFDGFKETPPMQRVEVAAQSWRPLALLLFRLSEHGIDESQALHSVLLLAFPAAFFAVFLATCAAIRRLGSRAGGAAPHGPHADAVTTLQTAGRFVLTLVPIAVAYHLAHYLGLLLTSGQLIVPLVSDPFGRGWDLFGTAGRGIDLAFASPYVVWYGAVVLIVVGHIVAVVAAHREALHLFGGARAAIASQWPMLALMVAYTSLSLWIMAQPIVG